MTAIRVVVADDQAIVREGLVGLLELVEGVEVVGAAADGAAAVALVEATAPDVAIVDLRMPGIDGIAATRSIVAGASSTRVLVLTTHTDEESIAAALSAGASGYLTKDATAEQLVDAIRVVHGGGLVLDARVQRRLVDRVTGERPAGAVLPSAPPGVPTPPAGLTPRELDVLRLMALGRSNQEIADELVVGMATVKTHVNNLFAKLAVRDRAQAVAFAYQHGLVPPSPPTG